MSRFTDTVRQDTPRLVVEYQVSESGHEQFHWGVAGKLPILTVIGFIVRVQAELAFRKPEECDQMALVIAYTEGKFDYFVNSGIPVDSLVGMLEAIKTTLIDSQMTQNRHKQVNLFGPDGTVYRR